MSEINDSKIYNLIFNTISNISMSGKNNDEKVKIIRIITKIIENIVKAETNNEDSEKFRRIKLNNPNISLMLEIKGNTDFIKSLGFQEELKEDTLTLYLPKEKLNIPLFQKLLSYIELLVLNFDENGVKQSNFYEKNSIKKSVYSQDVFKNKNNFVEETEENKEAKDFLDSIKESEERKLEDDNNYNNNDYNNNYNNNYDNNYNDEYNDNYNNKNLDIDVNKEPSHEGLDFLKETGQQRYQNALKNKQKPNLNFGKDNKKENRFKPDIHSFKDYNNNNNNNANNKKPILTKKNNKFKPDIHSFKDYGEIDKKPSNNNANNKKKLPSNTNKNKNKNKPEQNFKNNNLINYQDIKCSDKIGVKCLELTNKFRAKHNLPPLKWNDDIWRISLTHSKDMGNKRVPFGHQGFEARLSQFPFTYNLACENVYTCSGYADDEIADAGVEGWINSPGHRANLLSKTNLCAIASYKNSSGSYYLTQMFAKSQ